MQKIGWYLQKLMLLLWVCIRLFFYLILHPWKAKELFFAIFSSINEFYTLTHGGLKDFEKTQLFEKITQQLVFAQSNLFNRDSKVTRSMETHFMATLIKVLNPSTIFEIGTYNGFTTLHMAVNSALNCRIYTLDLPPGYEAIKGKQYSYDDKLVVKLSQSSVDQRYYKGHAEERKITEIFGDSSSFDYTTYRGKIDLIFIDGNHSFDYVKKDTENAFQMLSPKGVIVWHDFDYIIHKDVFNYLRQLSVKHLIFTVPHTRFAIYGKEIF